MVPVLFITGISIFRSLLTAVQMCLRLFSKYLPSYTCHTRRYQLGCSSRKILTMSSPPRPSPDISLQSFNPGLHPQGRGRCVLLPDFSQRKLTIKPDCALSPSPPLYSLGLQGPFLLLLPLSLLWKSFYTHTHTHAHTHAHKHAYTSTHICMHTHTYIHTHTCTHVKV